MGVSVSGKSARVRYAQFDEGDEVAQRVPIDGGFEMFPDSAQLRFLTFSNDMCGYFAGNNRGHVEMVSPVIKAELRCVQTARVIQHRYRSR